MFCYEVYNTPLVAAKDFHKANQRLKRMFDGPGGAREWAEAHTSTFELRETPI